VMVVTVEQAFAHCPKALVRSDLWKAASGVRPQGVPTLGDFVAARDPEQTVPRSTHHTANAFRTSFTDGVAARGPHAPLHGCCQSRKKRMSEMGHQTRSFGDVCSMSGLPPQADLSMSSARVSDVPILL
jgi:hypothetical protein